MSTTGKRKNSAAKRKKPRILTGGGASVAGVNELLGPAAPDRPFDPDVLRRAREIAGDYQIVVRHEDGEYVGRGLEMPECIGTGATPGKCVENARELMTTAVAVMLEAGDTPPPPAFEGARTEQVNMRLKDAEEHQQLQHRRHEKKDKN
jgi:predicted RNase H-like HicB family nuclease